MNLKEAQAIATTAPLDFEKIGFMCGLEIHQQLDTRKLFSPCPSGVVDPDEVARLTVARVNRRLRATQSELGDIDAAALAEARKQKAFQYLVIDGLTSLVELDEEPPHALAPDALQVGLQFAGLLGARPAAEVQVMRKTVIDGSNTSGFQRTALFATGGSIDVEGGDVGVWTIALEEDSARKVDDDHGIVTYSLDRLGVPLIEIATAPEIKTPKHAQATAARLGGLLRATGKVRRGLGSIRQDLNVSVAVGRRVELKGCQDLRAVPDVIERECRRQLWLHFVSTELDARGFTADSMGEPVDITKQFTNTESGLVAQALNRKQSVWGIRLPHWKGLIAGAAPDAPRLGREFADHAKVAAGVRGVFHSDELPAYGISEAEVAATAKALECNDNDGFVLCVERNRVARMALEAVAERAIAALDATASEVRAAQPDNTTRFMRPMPTAARMYPETDVPPTRITSSMWHDVMANLPLRPEERIAALKDEHGLNDDMAGQLVRQSQDELFIQLAQTGSDAALIGRVLTQFLPELKNQDWALAQLPSLFEHLAAGDFSKEAVPEILAQLDSGATDVAAAIAAAGLEAADDSVVEEVVARVVSERLEFIRERGMAAMGPVMGPIMTELRGKADGQAISKALQAEMKRVLAE